MNMNALLPLGFVILLASGCGDDSGKNSDLADAGPVADAGLRTIDLIGTWTASSQIFTNNANAEESYDNIANGGETRMVVLAGGGTRTFMSIAGVPDDHDGSLEVIGDILRLTTIETPPRFWNWSYSLQGDTLTLEDQNQTFDFTLSGAAKVPATEQRVVTRQ